MDDPRDPRASLPGPPQSPTETVPPLQPASTPHNHAQFRPATVGSMTLRTFSIGVLVSQFVVALALTIYLSAKYGIVAGPGGRVAGTFIYLWVPGVLAPAVVFGLLGAYVSRPLVSQWWHVLTFGVTGFIGAASYSLLLRELVVSRPYTFVDYAPSGPLWVVGLVGALSAAIGRLSIWRRVSREREKGWLSRSHEVLPLPAPDVAAQNEGNAAGKQGYHHVPFLDLVAGWVFAMAAASLILGLLWLDLFVTVIALLFGAIPGLGAAVLAMILSNTLMKRVHEPLYHCLFFGFIAALTCTITVLLAFPGNTWLLPSTIIAAFLGGVIGRACLFGARPRRFAKAAARPLPIPPPGP